MDELKRFAKKASDYRSALQKSPNSRILELYPIFYLLRLHVAASSIPIAKLKVVDLMSGSGFLSGKLYRAGFRNLHAIECCDAMCQDAQIYNSEVVLHRISSFEHLDEVLESIKPDIIVSLASFHHLLCYDSLNCVDSVRSLEFQKSVIDTCMMALPRSGLLLIADLMEDDVCETEFPEGGRSMRRAFRDLASVGLPHNISDTLKSYHTIRRTSAAILSNYCNHKGNVSLAWFRETVDKRTSIGHKDMAVSSDLLKQLAKYKPCVAKYQCPWIFHSKDEESAFVYLKFGFALDAEKSRATTADEVCAMAEKVLGIINIHDKRLLGWNLGIVVLWKEDPFISSQRYRLLIWCLLAIAALLVGALFLRSLAGVYARLSWDKLLIFALTLPIGIAFGDVLHSWAENTRRK